MLIAANLWESGMASGHGVVLSKAGRGGDAVLGHRSVGSARVIASCIATRVVLNVSGGADPRGPAAGKSILCELVDQVGRSRSGLGPRW